MSKRHDFLVLAGCIVMAGIAAPHHAQALNVTPNYGNLNPAQRAAVDQAIAEWEAVLSAKDANVTISFSFHTIDEGLMQPGVERLDIAGAEGVRAGGPGVLAGSSLGTTMTDQDPLSLKPRNPSIAINDKFLWNNSLTEPPVFGVGEYDLLTVLRHEIGHALGFSTQYSKFGRNVKPGPGANRTYNAGGAPTATLTPVAQGTHTDPTAHPGDIMNPGLPAGTRRPIGPLAPAILNHDVWKPNKSTPPPPCFQVPLFADQFYYPNGNLTPSGGWYAHSGGGSKPIQINARTIVVQESAGPGEDVNHPFPLRIGSATTYGSILLKLPGGQALGSVNDYFFHFRPAANDSNNFVARTYIGPPTAGGDYTLGVAAGSLTSTPLAPWAAGLTFGQTYRVVIRYDGITGTSSLWVNPAGESSTSVSSTSAGLANRLLASIALRQASPAGAAYGVIVDDVRVGDWFDDVICSTNAAPLMSGWSLMFLSATMLLAGGMLVERRRRMAA